MGENKSDWEEHIKDNGKEQKILRKKKPMNGFFQNVKHTIVRGNKSKVWILK